jgi:hypothetical protein
MALLRALVHLLAHSPESGPGGSGPAPSWPAVERRRRAFCAYHAGASGDRVWGYDGARRVAWVERVER